MGRLHEVEGLKKVCVCVFELEAPKMPGQTAAEPSSDALSAQLHRQLRQGHDQALRLTVVCHVC